MPELTPWPSVAASLPKSWSAALIGQPYGPWRRSTCRLARRRASKRAVSSVSLFALLQPHVVHRLSLLPALAKEWQKVAGVVRVARQLFIVEVGAPAR